MRAVKSLVRMCWAAIFFRFVNEVAALRATRGASPASLIYRLIPRPDRYRGGTIRNVHRFGYSFEVDLSDLVGWYLYWDFLDPSHEALVRLLSPGDVFIDVGANIGVTALRGAAAVSPSGCVVALEPHPANVAALLRHVSVNKVPVHVVASAAGDAPGTLELMSPNPHNAGMVRVALPGCAVVATASVVTLDDLIDELDLDRVSMIKIDVEGWEYRVLRGAQRVLRTHRPILFIEVIDANLRTHGSSAADVLGFLRGLGYECHRFDGRPVGALRGLACDLICTPEVPVCW